MQSRLESHQLLNELEIALGEMDCNTEEILKADLEFLDAIHEYRVLRDQIKMAEAKKKKLSDKIAKCMGKRFYAVDDDGIIICEYKENKPSIRFDEAKFEQDYPQLHMDYLYESKTIVRPLRVK